MAYTKKAKKVKRVVESAVAHVKSSFNNTLVAITTHAGAVLLRSSAGRLGFKGSRKATPFAASQIAASLVEPMRDLGIRSVQVNLRGPGSGRESFVRGLFAAGINVEVLREVTRMPRGGVCRPPKKRRV